MAFGDLIQSSFSQGGAGNDASWSDSFAVQPTEGNLLICVAVRQQTGGITVTDGDSNVFSQAVVSVADFSPKEVVIAYRLAGASQHQTITMTPSASDLIGLAIAEYEGPWEEASLDKTATAKASSGSTVSSGTTATTAQADELAVCAFVTMPATGPTLTNSFTLDEFIDHTAGSGQRPDGILGHKVLTATQMVETTLDMGGSISGGGAAGAMATFMKEAAATGGQAGVGGGLVGAGLAGGRGGLAA